MPFSLTHPRSNSLAGSRIAFERPSRRRTLRRIGLSLALLLPGCGSLEGLGDALGRPSARIQSVSISDLSLEGLTLDFDVQLSNPYSVALPLLQLDYALNTSGESLLSGRSDVEGSVPARGDKVVRLPVKLGFAALLDLGQGLKPGAVVPYAAQLKLGVEAPLVGRLEVPVRHRGEFPIPTGPEFSIPELQIDRLDIRGLKASVGMRVRNLNEFPIDLTRLDYALQLGGSKLIETGLSESLHVDDGGQVEWRIPISISSLELGMATLDLLRGEEARMRMTGDYALETPFGALGAPLDTSSLTRLKH